jgi:5-hydroxyisourate hydrolase
MSTITTHVLDTARGRPASGVRVTLETRAGDGTWTVVGSGATDGDGRLRDLLDAGALASPGVYRLRFDTGAYFASLGTESFYPEVTVEFQVRDARHHHIPLLLSPYGYSTYRGS